jgi:hypothetical protein
MVPARQTGSRLADLLHVYGLTTALQWDLDSVCLVSPSFASWTRYRMASFASYEDLA